MIPKRIIWHHSADATQTHQFDKINLYHKSKKFPYSSMGFWVGYHYLIEPDGVVKQARSENEIGAHDTGENSNSIGICLAGNFNLLLPNEAQVIAVAKLVADIKSRHNIPIARIEPHRWDDDTDCPGKYLSDNWLTNEYLKRHADPLVRSFQWLGNYLKLL